MAESWQTEEQKTRDAEKAARLAAWRESVAREKAEVVEREQGLPVGSVSAFLEDHIQAGGDVPLILPKQYDDADDLNNLGVDWSEWTEEGCERRMLAWVYGTRHSSGDRRNPNEKILGMSEVGIPSSEAQLAPRSLQRGGIRSVLETTIWPLKIAASFLCRDPDGSTWTGNPWSCPQCGTVHEGNVLEPSVPRPCAACGAIEQLRGTTYTFGTGKVSLWWIKRIADEREWRPEERKAVHELEYRFKLLFEKWRERGWLVAEPVMKFSEGDQSGVGRDGLPEHCRLTYKVIEAAEKAIKGTPLASGPRSQLSDAPPEWVSRVRDEAPWYYREFKDGSKAGT